MEPSAVIEQTTGGSSSSHRSPEEIAAYLCDELLPADRERFQAHLALCRECRWEVTSARRLSQTTPPRQTGRNLVLAAALLVVAVLLARDMGGFGAGPAREALRRSSEPAVRARTIDIASPEDGAILSMPSVVFAWRELPGDFNYRLTVSTDDGRTLWTGDTRGSKLALPTHVVLDRGRRYFWYVDALGSDGRSSTSDVRWFSTPP
jgi:hypothetical protein